MIDVSGNTEININTNTKIQPKFSNNDANEDTDNSYHSSVEQWITIVRETKYQESEAPITEEHPSTTNSKQGKFLRYCYSCNKLLSDRFLCLRRENKGIATSRLFCSIECRSKVKAKVCK